MGCQRMYAELQLCIYHMHATLRMQHCVSNIMHAYMRDQLYVRVHMHGTVLERVHAYIQHMHIIYMPYIYATLRVAPRRCRRMRPLSPSIREACGRCKQHAAKNLDAPTFSRDAEPTGWMPCSLRWPRNRSRRLKCHIEKCVRDL